MFYRLRIMSSATGEIAEEVDLFTGAVEITLVSTKPHILNNNKLF
jgi:hypothetical protein